MATTEITCTGRGTANGDHCCYLDGTVCLFLEEPRRGRRRFRCALRATLGSWDAVNASPEYQPIGDHWQAIGQPRNYCETYQPAAGVCCAEARLRDRLPARAGHRADLEAR